jgi:hypothetical protein
VNRAERRRQAREQRLRSKRWADNILRFHQASGGVTETYIIHIHEAPRLQMIAACGEPTARALAKAISTWASAALKPGADMLCLNCDTTFGLHTAPHAFAVALPFADRGHAIAAGICARCVAHGGDLHQMALRRWRAIWPDAYSASGGHA